MIDRFFHLGRKTNMKYHEQYNNIKEHFIDDPENQNNYIKFATALNDMINESLRAKRLQDDLPNIINFYKSMPKDIQLYYLHIGLTSYNKKKLIILPYLIIENIKYVYLSINEVYILDYFFTAIEDNNYFSNQNLIIFLIGIQNLLPYNFLYKNNNTIIHIIIPIINYCIDIPSLKYLSRSIAISMLNHIKDYNINIDKLCYSVIIKTYTKLFQENLRDIDLFEFCIYTLSKTNKYTIYSTFIYRLQNYINCLFQDYDEYNDIYDNFNIKVMFCNIMIKYKDEFVNNLERISQYYRFDVISIKQYIYQCEEFLTLVDMKGNS